jgi:thioredoxin-like negative regulator of GroEL
MSNEKLKSPKPTTAGAASAATANGSGFIKPPAPLYRSIDWLTFGLTTLFTFLAYYYTLAPDLTLEDSGELAVGSFYAGVPHPPGYPVWTIYTWLFTVLVPISNIAWRVALASAVAASASCGLLALMVSRGSSMMIEGIADFKSIEKKWENGLCVVAGFVAGCLLAFNGFYWSQAIIVEVYCFGVLSLMGVLCCLLRWVYAPHQYRYLYIAALLFGICFTNHQTLLVAAMGIEVAVLAVNPKLGRDLFLFNSIVYCLGLYGKYSGYIGAFDGNLPLYVIYNAIGVWSVVTALWYSLKTDWFAKLKITGVLVGANVLAWLLFRMSQSQGNLSEASLTMLLLIINALGFVLLYVFYAMSGKAERLFTEWKPMLIVAGAWAIGAGFYFFMPLASMSNPPMNWGYPRQFDGFLHALSRGQYERTNPTNDVFKFLDQVRMYFEGATEEFSFAYLLFAIVPFLFYKKLQKRERSWMIGLTAIFFFLGFLLLVLLNPGTDKQSRDLNKVFFTASYSIIAIGVGYGLTFVGCLLATQYEKYREWALYAAAGVAGMAIYSLAKTMQEVVNPLLVYTAIFGVALAGLAIVVLFFSRRKAPMICLLCIYAVMPVHSITAHWSDNEQRGHLFGFWFGHDMFTPPDFGKPGHFYPKMDRNTILFGGTDPGRFCPTYMIFCESFIPPQKRRDPDFDRRDVYIITQNALADSTYLNYIRAHYNRSTQVDSPFFQEMFRSAREKEANVTTNLLARMVSPLDHYFTRLGKKIEDRRRREGVYPPVEIHTPSIEESKKCFEDYIADAQHRLMGNQLEPGEDVRIVDNRVQVSGQVSVMQINGLLTKVIFDANPTNEFYVEESFPLKWMYPHLTPFGIIMKLNREQVPEFTEEMVKKDHEFWSLYSERLCGNWITYDTPVREICDFADRVYRHMDYRGFKGDRKFVRDNDAQKAFSKLRSAQAGLYAWRINAVKPGSAEQARMLKEADFAFKQSFAFCPYSPEAVFRYINLLATTQRIEDALLVAQTCQKFDPENKGVTDLVNQLTNIKQSGGAAAAAAAAAANPLAQLEQQYESNPTNPQIALSLANAYLQKQQTNRAYALFDQAINLLLPTFRANPAEPNTAFLLAQAYQSRQMKAEAISVLDKLISKLEPVCAANSTNDALAFNLVQAYVFRQKTAPAIALLDRMIAPEKVETSTLMGAAQFYAQMGSVPKLEMTLMKLVKTVPDNAEAWYDLAALQAVQNKNNEAVQSLSHAVELSNKRAEKQPGTKDLAQLAASDPRMQNLRQMPEYKKLVKTNK